MTDRTDRPAIAYPTAEELDTLGYSRDDWTTKLYLVPAGEREDGRPGVTIFRGVGQIGWPMLAAHGRCRSIGSYGTGIQGESVRAALESMERELLALSEAYEGTKWDGSNRRGVWDDEDCRLDEAVGYAWDRERESLVRAWDAYDWYADGPSWTDLCADHGIDPERGEDVLDEMTEAEERRYVLEGVLVDGVERHLRWLLGEYLEQLNDDDEDD